MEIVEIYNDLLYSIGFDEEDLNEYDRVFKEWHDLDYLISGKYKCLWSLEPVKSYGPYSPSLLRLYAIKLDSNCYLIVYGGIKLGSTIQESPVLKDKVFNKIDAVLTFLKINGITESNDL